ncbi:hypothetical protein AYI70_g12122 [Smittium culicis]|uniref:Uncharacterized protein n=1 Tax=Smittium culicis TaxID=133412 RepID=A0A1R1WYS5_9FUNG|nr:hypothetical protein AYI70_g12122 [Smittium culicis]
MKPAIKNLLFWKSGLSSWNGLSFLTETSELEISTDSIDKSWFKNYNEDDKKNSVDTDMEVFHLVLRSIDPVNLTIGPLKNNEVCTRSKKLKFAALIKITGA